MRYIMRLIAIIFALGALVVGGLVWRGSASDVPHDEPAAGNGQASSQAAAAETSLAHQPGTALFGYYRPLQDPPLQVGEWVLDWFYVGSDWEVDPWVAYPGSSDYPPAGFDFSDPSSEWIQGEAGGGYDRQLRVWPDSLTVTVDTIAFEGMSEALGPVSFQGHYRRDLILAAEATGNTDEVVLEGNLTIDGVVHENLRFGWFAGD